MSWITGWEAASMPNETAGFARNARGPGSRGAAHDRSTRTRRALLSATRDLMHDGVLAPSAAHISRRAGLSRRSLYVHFDTVEGVVAATVQTAVIDAFRTWQPPPTALPLPNRIDMFCQRWRIICEALRLPGRIAGIQPHVPEVVTVQARTRRWGNALVDAVFEPELERSGPERPRLASALHLVTSWSGWDDLRRNGVSADAVGDTLRTSLRRLLGPSAPPA
jgi:TetR/AcrR family transcriptional regulator, regulator of autoinduction and epiphytic fitness